MLSFVMSFESTQSWAAKKASNWLNKNYELQTSLAGLKYSFPNKFKINELYIPDEEGDTLIYSKSLRFQLTAFNSKSNSLIAHDIELIDAKYYQLIKEGDSLSNLQKFTRKFKSNAPKEEKPSFKLNLKRIIFKNSNFRLEDINCDVCTTFWLENIDLDLKKFDLDGPEIMANINRLKSKNKYHFDIDNLQGDFLYSAEELSLKDAIIETPLSYLKGSFSLNYDSTKAFKNFLEEVNINANFSDSSQVASEDIETFADKFPRFGDIGIEGLITGTVNNLKADAIVFRWGESSIFQGNLNILDPGNKESFYIKAEDALLLSSSEDIENMIGVFTDSAMPPQIALLEDIEFNGSFNGFLDEFRTNGSLKSSLGLVSANLFFDNKQLDMVAYQGQLTLDQFDLAKVVGDSSFGRLSADMSLNGKGFDPNEMETSLLANVDLFEFKDYPYQGTKIDGSISKGNFIGELQINDPNLKFDFNGQASLNREISQYDFKAKLDTANLFALNLSTDSISNISSEMDINFKAKNYDRWQGTIKVHNTGVRNSKDSYFFEDIVVESNSFQDSNKYINVESNILDLEIKGEYTLAKIRDAFAFHFQKYNSLGTKEIMAPVADFSFDMLVKDMKVISEVFIPELWVEPNSKISGRYFTDLALLDFNLNSPGIEYKQNILEAIDLKYFSSEQSSKITFDIFYASLANGLQIDSLILANQLRGDSLFFDFNCAIRDSIRSDIDLLGYAVKSPEQGYNFGLRESSFNIGEEDFFFNDKNLIHIDTGGVYIEDLILYGDGEKILVNGNISKSQYEVLRVDIEGFNMDLVNYFIGSEKSKFRGEIHGGIILSQSLTDHPRFASNLYVDSLSVNENLLGDMSLLSNWIYGSNKIPIDLNIASDSLKLFELKGDYYVNAEEELDMKLKFNRFKLFIFNPFIEGIGENLRGFANGDLIVKGNLEQPSIQGDIKLIKVGMMVSILETNYNLDGIPLIRVDDNKLKLDNVRIRDSQFGNGYVSGSIEHNNFKDFYLDLSIQAKELMALNTTASTEGSYFGRAFVSGEVKIIGPPGAIDINANVKAVKNSSFFLALDAAREVNQSDFVSFVPAPEESDSIEERLERRNTFERGLELNFNITVDQTSMVKVLWDQSTGTGLTGYGDGVLKLRISNNQDIQMFGTYTIDRGNYLLSLANIIKRDFQVERGGTVAWNGNPVEPIVNISATYATRADPSVLVPNYDGGRTAVNVFMNLSGELSDRNITFNLTLPSAPSSTQTAIASRLIDDDKMIHQVFSLLATNSFAPNDGLGGGLNDVANPLDVLAGQASSWISQMTGDYAVNLGYQNAGSSTNTTTGTGVSQEEVEIGVSKKFFKDRVTINGRVGVAVGENQRSDQFAGDFEVEYNITEDGRFRTKAFNRSVQDQYSITEQNYQQGIGLSYRLDFNTWGEFFNVLFHQKKKDKEKSENPDSDGKKEDLPDGSIDKEKDLKQ